MTEEYLTMEAGSTMNKNDLLLYVITDCDNLQGEALLARTEAILASGATMLQYLSLIHI